MKFFRFNYQLIWEQQDQTAYNHFPQVLTEVELLPFIKKYQNKHRFYKDLTTFPTSDFEQMNLDEHFITEQPETTDNIPYTSSKVISETSFDEGNAEILQQNLNDQYGDPIQDQEETPQEKQYEDAPQEQPIRQHDTSKHEQLNTITIQYLPDPSDVTTNN